ncbi:hypothetical protein ACTXJY_00340 [Corynebacterium casei]|uniref:hypothetical protein n=1 Tax=Corynebacterium casei TaxID=160386 RepID=UPI003FD00CE1
MTIKPSNMPQRGVGITRITAVSRDHEKRLEREQAMFDTSVEQVTNLFDHFIEEVTDSQQAAATLALATVMNLEEEAG